MLKIAKRKEQIDSRVQLVADYVVLHPREKYTPQKMAEMVELSKQRFSSLFKADMKMQIILLENLNRPLDLRQINIER